MSGRIQQLGRHLGYVVFSNAIYGVALYWLVTWLAGYSLALAYLGNLAMIAAGLAYDAWGIRYLTSAAYLEKLKGSGDYASTRWLLSYYVSFKAVLYLFYAMVMVIWQVVTLGGIAVAQDFGVFLETTGYSVLIVIAVDEFTERYSQGRAKAAKGLSRLRKLSGE